MNLSAPVKVLAFVVFLAALAGATYGVQQYMGTSVEDHPVGVQAARSLLNATPGHTVTYAVTLHNRVDAARDLVAVAAGEGIEARASAVSLPAHGNATVFLSVEVPQGLAPGDHRLALRVEDANGTRLRERPDALTLRILAGGPAPFAQGDVGQVVYTGRLAESGRVFNTNDPLLQHLGFPKTETYQFSRGGALPVETLPQPSVVPGFYENVLGMLPGESRTFTFGPEKGYGANATEERVPRVETLKRRETLDLPTASLSHGDFAEYLRTTNQGVPADFEVGDVVVNQRGTETLRYAIVNKTDEGVDLRLKVEVGERYTIYDFWRNGSLVEAVTETAATFYTTPTTEENATFTFLTHWPEMSRVARLTDDEIVVRHDPSAGLKYSQPTQFQGPRQYEVVSLTDDEVVVSSPNPNPLAGRSLTFDVLMLSYAKQDA